MKRICEALFGRALRNLPSASDANPTAYLTFDDGPVPEATERVLALLERFDAHATFFVVADRVRANPGLTRKIIEAGHALGNHSFDHGYRAFFSGRRAMLHWVQRSEAELAELLGGPTVGFRPPVGIRTPELAWALRQCELPLVLWQERFYDAVWPWRPARAAKAARRLPAGAIVLLHDANASAPGQAWLASLELYIQGLQARGFALKALTREGCQAALANR